MPLLRSAPTAHRILVVEDHPASLELALSYLKARGDDPRGVGSVEEAFRAMQEEDFCLFIVDQELPDTPGGVPTEHGGPRILEAIRKADPRRAGIAGAAYLTPIVVWSGFSMETDFVWSMKDLGADGFVLKGNCEEKLKKEVARRLRESGRADHADCAAFAAELAGVSARPMSKTYKDEIADPITLEVIGAKGTGAEVEINGEKRTMQNAKFLVLLLLIDAFERSHVWLDRKELGLGDSRETISRVRAVFRGLAPEGFNPIQSDRDGRFRLHPEVNLKFVPWKELEEHPHPGVRKLAVRHNAWREEERRSGSRRAGGWER